MSAICDLSWIRIFDPELIPKIYIDQIKSKNFTTERFCQYQKNLCLIFDHDLQMAQCNPFNLLWALVDKENKVKGFCWMVIDELENALVINSFSMDNEYWGNGQCVSLLKEKALKIQKGAKLDRIYWITKYPKHSEKFGFKKSKNILMEYKENG